MSTLSFLGLSKEQWDFINSFSNWFAAIGTLAAVFVSLWLAARASRIRTSASVGHRLIMEPGAKGKPPEVVVFRLVNTGDRIVRITGIGWKIGFRRWQRNALQMHDPSQSSPLPVELNHGQEASWVVPLDAREEGWLESFSSKMLMPNWRFSTRFLRAQFFTSVGEVITVVPEASLLHRIRETCERLSANDG
ncbi:MAG: hypothetical protein Q7T13_13420 [Polaromonas sp.]|nr:hypothetical protein [Polaromonas sp.]